MTTPRFTIEIAAPSAYPRAKSLLNAGRHPVFIGPNMVARSARQGGLLFAVVRRGHHSHDAAVALLNVRTSTLLVLNIHPHFRGVGLGSSFLEFLRPNFARVLATTVPWFQQRHYSPLGEPQMGRRLLTQVMVRRELLGLAGRVAQYFRETCRCALP